MYTEKIGPLLPMYTHIIVIIVHGVQGYFLVYIEKIGALLPMYTHIVIIIVHSIHDHFPVYIEFEKIFDLLLLYTHRKC